LFVQDKKPQVQYRQLFYSLLEASPLPVVIIDRELVVLAANEAALRLCEQKEFTPEQSLAQILPDKDVFQLVETTLQQGKPQRGQYNKSARR